MRFSRILGVFAVVAVVAPGAAWRVASSQGSPRPRAAAAPTTHAKATSSQTTLAQLQRELQQQLRDRPGARSPLLPSGPSTCAVDDGSCSLTPCVLFIGSQPGTAAAAATSSAVAQPLRQRVVPDQIPASGCQGRIGTPNTF